MVGTEVCVPLVVRRAVAVLPGEEVAAKNVPVAVETALFVRRKDGSHMLLVATRAKVSIVKATAIHR